MTHHLHLERITDHLHLWTGAVGMIAAMNEYVDGLPKVRKAFMAAVLLLAGGFGGGVMATTVAMRSDLVRFNAEHRSIFKALADDEAAMDEMRASHAHAIRDVTEAINNLTCDINEVPNSRCEWWIDNGRPDL